MRVAETGMRHDGREHRGYMYLLTVTAPGSGQHLDTRSGTICPCTPAGGTDLGTWNAGHSARWNHLRTNLARDYDGMQYLRAVEVQLRGALHDHAILWSPIPLGLEHVRSRAIAAGFGHSVDLAPIVPGSRKAAYYVAKYVTKACDSREQVPWTVDKLDRETGELVAVQLESAPFRTWSSSRAWGITMKAVRAAVRASITRAPEPPAPDPAPPAVPPVPPPSSA